MFPNNDILAIIPARGGSKRLPRKNMLSLGGVPLIDWTIKAALECRYLSNNIVVSSDSTEILEHANSCGVFAMNRPKEFATDEASSISVIINVLNTVAQDYKYIVLLQPTSPFRNALHIDEAIEQLYQSRSDAVISVCEMEHSPLWSNILPEDNSMDNFIEERFFNTRSQDLPKHYRVNGAIYICDKTRLMKEKNLLLGSHSVAYKMDKCSSLDIDNKDDFEFAEFLLSKMEGKALHTKADFLNY